MRNIIFLQCNRNCQTCWGSLIKINIYEKISSYLKDYEIVSIKLMNRIHFTRFFHEFIVNVPSMSVNCIIIFIVNLPIYALIT